MKTTDALLQIKNLHIRYTTDEGVVHAVNGIDLVVNKGETLGLVGETGAGKTTAALGVVRLVPDPPGIIVSGEILFGAVNLLKVSAAKMRKIRGNSISMIFQDPMTALNPVLTIGDQISEVIRLHDKVSRAEAYAKASAMLKLVGIPEERMEEYPHQFSGGMKQRVVIAIALVCNPQLLIADEPTTALDVTIQAQVLELMRSLKAELGTSMMLITHDLGVVAETCDKVAIMYAGEIVEYGSLNEVYNDTRHPYTKGLFGSVPSPDRRERRLRPIPGLMPDPTRLPEGCAFHPRCPLATEQCAQSKPPNIFLGGEHVAKCYYAKEERSGEQ